MGFTIVHLNSFLLWFSGALGRTRTYNLQIRSLSLYPVELREQMVSAVGFEPTTLASQTQCATRLRYAELDGVGGRTRTDMGTMPQRF